MMAVVYMAEPAKRPYKPHKALRGRRKAYAELVDEGRGSFWYFPTVKPCHRPDGWDIADYDFA